VAKAAKDSGFTPRETTVEVTGLCSHCRESATA
jgi:Fe2+ or Zn2+ uptake regulation protein